MSQAAAANSPATARDAAASNGAIIAFRGVCKRFGTLEVLRDIDIELRRGETTVIIGASGAGKSVVLKHIVRLLRPDRGEVFFKGRRIDDLPERDLVELRKHFGFLFQMGALFDSLTVAENIAFPVREHTRRGKKEVADLVREKLAMVGLDGTQDKKPAQLSGGQRKRVALARAIALDPEVILYDEPTTGLDPIRSDVINELIRKLQQELHVTSVVVTHDMASVRKVGDRVIMLHEGRFIFDGPPRELEISKDPHVARFVQGRASESDLHGLNLKGMP
jgi:phospholipid/cholesterol/gamma-HCH transport system ATP-binding protein